MKGLKTFLTILLFSPTLLLQGQNIELINGNWFDGEQFTMKESFYIVDGVFGKERPYRIDTILNLASKYVIPPFAEAHTHNLSSSYRIEEIVKRYLKEGTFYVQVLGCSDKARKEVSGMLNHPKSVDAVYSNGGITSTLGHPFLIYEPLAMGIYDSNESKKRKNEILKSRLALNDAYWFFDSVEDVDANWNLLLKTKPDVIKIMLIDIENYEKHQNDPSKIGRKGLQKEVARYVIKKAHHHGLKVYAHIATLSDFRTGLDMGVDVFAHMPGYIYGGVGNRNDFELTTADFKKAKDRGVAIIPTAHLATRRLPKEDGQERNKALKNILEFQSNFFKQASEYKIPLALGSDDFGETLMKEVDYLYQNDLLDELELLQMMTLNGAALCFPHRKIGHLKEGYEASMLVVNDNPLNNFKTIQNIQLTVKEGVLLNLE